MRYLHTPEKIVEGCNDGFGEPPNQAGQRHALPKAIESSGYAVSVRPSERFLNFQVETGLKPRMLPRLKKNILSLLLFIMVFAISRLPGMLSANFGNFSAAYALMFCGGVYLSRRTAWWLPLLAMLVTDLGLNFYYQAHGWQVWQWSRLEYQLFNYVAYVAIIALGKCYKPKHSFASLLGGGLLGALLFYFITNTASWLFNPFQNPEYTKTFFGWMTALIKGTQGWPETWQFFRNTFLSAGLFTGIFVAAMKYSEAAESALEKAPAEAEESEGKETPEEAKAAGS